MATNAVRCPSCKRDYPMLATAYVSRRTFEPICPECWARERYGDVAQHLHAQIERLEAEKAEMLRALEAVTGDSEESDYMTQAQIQGLCREAIKKARGEE